MVKEKFNPGCFSSDVRTRLEIARQGRLVDLDQLVRDPNEEVQQAVAEHGRPQDLNILMITACYSVKKYILLHYRRPEDKDALISDRDWSLRAAVAECGRPADLDRLVSDEDWTVRLAVARHGLRRHLEILKNDPEPYVRQMAIARLKGCPLPKP